SDPEPAFPFQQFRLAEPPRAGSHGPAFDLRHCGYLYVRPIAATICFGGTNPVHFSFRFITFQDFSTVGKDAAGGARQGRGVQRGLAAASARKPVWGHRRADGSGPWGTGRSRRTRRSGRRPCEVSHGRRAFSGTRTVPQPRTGRAVRRRMALPQSPGNRLERSGTAAVAQL